MLVWLRRAVLLLLGIGTCVTTSPCAPAFSTGSVMLAWNPSISTNVVGYKIYCGVACGTYNNAVFVANTTNGTISGLVEGTTYYFAATSVDTFGNESPFSVEATYTTPAELTTLRILSPVRPM